MLHLIACTALNAQVSFKVQAPPSVAMGERFQIVFVAEGGRGTDFNAPSFSGFDVLFGPAIATSSSIQIVNGRTSSSTSNSYTYTLMPQKEGVFNIGEASIRIKGDKYTTSPFKIKVLPSGAGSSASSSGGGNVNGAANTPSLNSNNLFYRAIVSKTKVYEQEAIAVTFKLFVNANIGIRQLEDLKMPEYDGFISQTVDDKDKSQLNLETYNGRNYRTAVIQQVILFPQKSGRLVIPAGMIELGLALPPDDDDIDPFFASPILVKRKLYTSPVAIDVQALPTAGKPSSFNGAVGSYGLKAEITSGEPKTNESLILRLTITGKGNIKLVSNPKVSFPSEFEVFDPKVENQLNVGGGSVTGTKTIEYYAVPRQTGKFTIPPIEFSYFDPTDARYKTIKSNPFELNVAKGKSSTSVISSSSNKEDVKLLNQDIRYLKKNQGKSTLDGLEFSRSNGYVAVYLLLLLISLIVLFVLRKQIALNADIVDLRHRKANKVAVKRLKQSDVYKRAGKEDEFYNEILQALWGYLGDKFKLPLSLLNRDNIRQALMEKGIDQETSGELLGIIDQAEFARYAPSGDKGAMDDLYSHTAEIIGKIENFKTK
ncbi:BatD family protein [Porphyromonas pogonae]|uniref:BatD family protein n=1 Tax=Porphyromonas pogonae TaxID=867595 RepID=UPI00300F2A38